MVMEQITGTKILYDLIVRKGMLQEEQELLWVIPVGPALTTLTDPIEVYRGTATRIEARPGEIFRAVLKRCNPTGIVLAHLHPGGEAIPTLQDADTFVNVQRAGELLGIPLWDVVITNSTGDYISLKAQGVLV